MCECPSTSHCSCGYVFVPDPCGTYGYFQHKGLWIATVVVVVVVLVLVPTAVIAGNVVLVVLVVVGVVVLAVVVVMAVGEVDYNTQLLLLRRFFVVISYGDWPTDPMAG